MRRVAAIAAALLASACATSGPGVPARVEIQPDGFVITQASRVGPGVRSDFADALGALRAGRTEDGIALLRQVTEAAPQATAAHIDLAMAYRATDALEEAEASLERALALSPKHPVAHNEMGIVQRRTGRFAQARASYEKALDTYPDFHYARRNLAILCDLYLEDARCAIENYELYLAAVPDDETAAIWLSDLRNRTGD